MEMDLSLALPSSTSQRTVSDLTLTLTLSPTPPPPPTANLQQHYQLLSGKIPAGNLKPEEAGVALIQLLLKCATHVSAGDLAGADTSLRLISDLASPSGDPLRRLSSHLASALAALLLRRRLPGLLSALRRPRRLLPAADLAFARALPYLPFVHAVTARTLLRSFAKARRCAVHLLDLRATVSSAGLWAPLLRSLARLPGSSPPRLTLTCVGADPHILLTLGSTLVNEAATAGVQLEFRPVESPLADFNPRSVHVEKDEVLAVAAVLALHELLACGGEMEGFLAALRAAGAELVVVAEQEAENGAGTVEQRLVEGLRHYGAVFDSVEAAGVEGEERAAVEEAAGREAEEAVAGERGRYERAEQWARRMGRAGFRQAGLWGDAIEEGRRVVESWHGGGGYGVVVERESAMISWHQQPLYAVSAWQP